MTSIKPCTCVHKAQDKMYGKDLRVHNWAPKAKAWRCTVCKREKQ